MKILLVICFFIPFICFGYLMSKLDNFLAQNTISIANTGRHVSSVVLGKTDLAIKTIELLENKGIHVINLTNPFQLIQGQKLCYLFALSESDADNIAFYKIGKRLYCIENMISICNDKRNENMFIYEKINYLLNEKASPANLFQNLLKNPEVKL